MFTGNKLPTLKDKKEAFIWSNIEDFLIRSKEAEKNGKSLKTLNQQMRHFAFLETYYRAKFTQGVSVFGAEDTTLNSESALNVAINEHFGLKVAYNVTWNSEPPESAPEHTDRRTTLSLGYSM